MNRWLNARVTSENTSKFRDVVYLVIADLEESADNVVVQESKRGIKKSKCPHYLVQGAVVIVKDYIRRINMGRQPEVLQKVKESTLNFTRGLKEIISALEEIKSKVSAIESKLK